MLNRVHVPSVEAVKKSVESSVAVYKHTNLHIPQKKVLPPKKVKHLTPENLFILNKMREESPRLYTNKFLQKKTGLSKKEVIEHIPDPRYHITRGRFLKAQERSAKKLESKDEKNERLVEWWKCQFNNIENHRLRRKELKKILKNCVREYDFEFEARIEQKDAARDKYGYQKKTEKRLAVAVNKK